MLKSYEKYVATRVAETYCRFSNVLTYSEAYAIGQYYADTNKCDKESIARLLMRNQINKCIDFDLMINIIRNAKYAADIRYRRNSAARTKKIKEEIKDAAFKYCSRKGYEAILEGLKGMNDEEIKVIYKFISQAAASFERRK